MLWELTSPKENVTSSHHHRVWELDVEVIVCAQWVGQCGAPS